MTAIVVSPQAVSKFAFVFPRPKSSWEKMTKRNCLVLPSIIKPEGANLKMISTGYVAAAAPPARIHARTVCMVAK